MKSYLTLCLLQFFGFIFFNPGVPLSWNCPNVFLDQWFLTVYQGKSRHHQRKIRTSLEEMPKCFFFQRAQTTTTITLTIDITPKKGSNRCPQEKELPKLQMLRTAD